MTHGHAAKPPCYNCACARPGGDTCPADAIAWGCTPRLTHTLPGTPAQPPVWGGGPGSVPAPPAQPQGWDRCRTVGGGAGTPCAGRALGGLSLTLHPCPGEVLQR